MTKPTPARTTGPLHFEDLEPHRSEDLVRRLIDIDETGDEWFRGPHTYETAFSQQRGPFRDYVRIRFATIGRFSSRSAKPYPAKRVQRFPRETGA